VNEPSLAVLEDRVWTTVPAFSTSIFTYDPTSPDDVHAISWLDPRTQDSPPFGEVTVIEDVDGAGARVKYVLLVSLIAVLAVLVIRIL
jgi:hypothetical protein